ncbi:hypothetical protein RvY_16738 [Ramazzottius varieornatus]|uniref:lysoplasmalogenase n=1 Tax=Ramazzottius varieornatus TaxID=947166 RepID=A0A1D1W5U4_RAMVA|nr:hypothetical protein RvY_16738 [Ramazzottius varieornatus]
MTGKLSSEDLRWTLPFCFATFLYTTFQHPHDEVTFKACLTKAAPIVALAIFVLQRGVCIPSRSRQSLCILIGLLFSAAGDVFLQLSSLGYFLPGMLAFGAGHVSYILASGTRPAEWTIGFPILLAGFSYYLFLLPKVFDDKIFTVALLVYQLLICSMLWRTIVRYRVEKVTSAKKNESKSQKVERGKKLFWLMIAVCGAVSFVISDSCLAWHMFVEGLEHEKLIVMGTYYSAQLLISLSILHEPVGKKANSADKKSSAQKTAIK